MTVLSVNQFAGTDPALFADYLSGLGLFAPVTYASATQTLGTVPAGSIITDVLVARTTKWDAVTTFEVGKSGDTDWLVGTVAANVTGAIDSGEDGGVERIAVNKYVAGDTDIVLTLNQGAASQGAGYVVILYTEVSR